MTAYDADFFKWTEETAHAIAEGRWDEIDRATLADEVESLGRRDRREARSRLRRILVHMLKAKYQSERQTTSWAVTLSTQRNELSDVFDESPSLQAQAAELIEDVYPQARNEAALETGLPESTFPDHCEWSVSQIVLGERESSGR